MDLLNSGLVLRNQTWHTRVIVPMSIIACTLHPGHVSIPFHVIPPLRNLQSFQFTCLQSLLDNRVICKHVIKVYKTFSKNV